MVNFNNPYLTIVNKFQKFDKCDFKDLQYIEVPVAQGDRGKTTAFIERATNSAFEQAKTELNAIGVKCELQSAGRNIQDQQFAIEEFYNKLISDGKNPTEAFKETSKSTLRPGYSEHHTGLAIDIKVDMTGLKMSQEIQDAINNDIFNTSPNFFSRRYVMEKCGFILSYASDPRRIGVSGVEKDEGWHWRYVTPEHSWIIRAVRERVEAITGERHEIFLEDYVSLLNKGLDYSSTEEMVQSLAETFVTDILKCDINTLEQ